MKIIVGLGNPGKQYEGTRHNIGFEFVEKLQSHFEFPDFSFNKKFNAEITEGSYQSQTTNQKLVLMKPQTFMNLSGSSVRAILDFYKLTPDDIIIIQDDIDIEIGTLKVATDSRSAGHNGVQNIIDTLGTQKFTRLRIGIGAITTEEVSCPPRLAETACRRETGRMGVHDFVLEKFSKEEQEKLDYLFSTIQQALQKILQG